MNKTSQRECIWADYNRLMGYNQLVDYNQWVVRGGRTFCDAAQGAGERA